MSALTIELWPGDNPADDLEVIGSCYAAVTDLLTPHVDLQYGERDHLATLLVVLGQLQQAATEQLRLHGAAKAPQ